MTANPDAVQVLAAALHQVECLPGSRRGATFTPGHHEADTVRAVAVLSHVAERSYHLTTVRKLS